MALQSSFYNTDGSSRTFPSTKHIATKQHVAVYLKRVADSVWVLATVESFSLVNNAVVFDTAPDTIIYSQIEVRVADTANELQDAPSDIALVAGSITNVNTVASNLINVDTVATNIGSVNTVSANIASVTNVSGHIADVVSVSSDIVTISEVAANKTNIDLNATNIIAIQNASANALATAADVLLTHADVVLTNADVVSSASSASNALAYLNDFKGRYYGALASEPTLDPLGNPITNGDLYFNTTSNSLKVFNGAIWVLATATASNVSNTPSGLVSSATVQDAINELDTEKANSGYTNYRNRIINGANNVNQINGTTAVTPTGSSYVSDQWSCAISQASKLTFQQVTDAPEGFKYSTKVTIASQYSPLATDYFMLQQRIEGQNITDFAFGTAGAVTLNTSNWIKGSVAGTYSVVIYNGSGRSYVGTINVTTTWTKVSITLVGDTTGTWNTDNTIGLIWALDLGSGSNFNTTSGTWQAGNFLRTAGSVTFVNQVAGSTLNITGVQLEKVPTGATQGTDYEWLPYDEELRRCQRYYQKLGGSYNNDILMQSYNNAGQAVALTLNISPMRVAPTVNKIGTWAVLNSGQPQIPASSYNTITINSAPTVTGAFSFGSVANSAYLTAVAEL